MGTGFVNPPMEFLSASLHTFDASLIRHTIVELLSAVEKPFSAAFTRKIVKMLIHENVVKAVSSKHFTEAGHLAFQNFTQSIRVDDIDTVSDALAFENLVRNLHHSNSNRVF